MKNLKIQKQSGATLGELLVAMLIVSFVGLIAVGGIIAFQNSYRKIKDTANTQILASNTAVLLRNRLKLADNIDYDQDGRMLVQDVDTGLWYTIISPGGDSIQMEIRNDNLDKDEDPLQTVYLVNDASSVKSYRTQFSSISYEDGFFTVHKLMVTDKNSSSDVYINLGDVKIRAINMDTLATEETDQDTSDNP